MQLDRLLDIDEEFVFVRNATKYNNIDIADIEISGIEIDSRKCKKGFLFAAYKGANADGRDYIKDAIENGAKVILTNSDYDISSSNINVEDNDDILIIINNNSRMVASKLISRFYCDKPDYIAFVTGTNGKSSVACFVSQLWRLLGYKAASIGTLGIQKNDIDDELGGLLTTPDAVTLNRELQSLKINKYQRVIIEASSHGLDLDRLVAIESDIAVFLNITRDHLDYHGDFENYYKAKLKIFASLKNNNSIALINSDIAEYEDIKNHCHLIQKTKNIDILSFGNNGIFIKLIDSILVSGGRNVEIEFQDKIYQFFFPFLNEFQVSNFLAAISVVIHSGENIIDIISVISDIKNVPGRMELAAINSKNEVPIYVDYAHTPDALENILESCREYTNSTNGRIILVFGCGGDRDKGKRKIMGEIAAKKADIVIITDDNPRTENAADIRHEIAKSCAESCIKAKNIADRKIAIKKAIALSKKGDIVIIAGKGHEKYQIIADRKINFDDIEVVKESLEELQKTG